MNLVDDVVFNRLGLTGDFDTSEWLIAFMYVVSASM